MRLAGGPSVGTSLMVLLLVSGCGDDSPQGGPRVPTYPVQGQVLIDGVPTAQVQVTCHRVDGESPIVIPVSGITDAEGKFSIGTYEGGDGAPVGDYVLTFVARQISLMSGQYGGPDKLNDRYSDPKKSEIKFSVKEGGDELDLGQIQLVTK